MTDDREAEIADGQELEQNDVTPERRDGERTKSQIQRTVPATLEFDGEGPTSTHLYIMDISRHGLRVNLDRRVEPESRFRLMIPLAALGFGLEGQIDSLCRVAWAKPLASGTCIVGLRLLETSEDHLELMLEVIDHWKRRADLNLVRLQIPIGVKLRSEPEALWSPVLGGRALSGAGIRFHYSQSLSLDQELELRLLLESGTIQIRVQVRWCEIMPNGVYEIGCGFLAPNARDRDYIELHLKRSDHGSF